MRNNKISSFEKSIFLLCIKHKLPFFFVGNGMYFIDKINPDFKHVQYNLFIETFYSGCHAPDYVVARQQVYDAHGFKCLFIDESYFASEDWEGRCLIAIQKFLKDNETYTNAEIKKENFYLRGYDIYDKFYFNKKVGIAAVQIIDFLKSKPDNKSHRKELMFILNNDKASNYLDKALNLLLKLGILCAHKESYSKIYELDVTKANIDLTKHILNRSNFYKLTTKSGENNYIFHACAIDILAFVKTNNLNSFRRRDINGLQYSYDAITKALRHLKNSHKLIAVSKGKHTKYSVACN